VFWPGAALVVMIAAIIAAPVINGGRSTSFTGALLRATVLNFASTQSLLPPRTG
jgi:Ca2+:H+ antiporter